MQKNLKGTAEESKRATEESEMTTEESKGCYRGYMAGGYKAGKTM